MEVCTNPGVKCPTCLGTYYSVGQYFTHALTGSKVS